MVLDSWTPTLYKSLTDLLSSPYMPIAADVLIDTFDDGLAQLLPLHFLLLKLCYSVLLQLLIPDQVPDEVRFDTEALCSFSLGNTIFVYESQNLLELINVE